MVLEIDFKQNKSIMENFDILWGQKISDLIMIIRQSIYSLNQHKEKISVAQRTTYQIGGPLLWCPEYKNISK